MAAIWWTLSSHKWNLSQICVVFVDILTIVRSQGTAMALQTLLRWHAFSFFSPAMSNYIFTMLVFTFHEWIFCLSRNPFISMMIFCLIAIGDDFRMTIYIIWYQLWSSKLENIKLQITLKRFTKTKSESEKSFFHFVHNNQIKCLKSNIVYCYALCRAILVVIDHLRYECFCATANKTKVWLM